MPRARLLAVPALALAMFCAQACAHGDQAAKQAPKSTAAKSRPTLEAPPADRTFQVGALRVQRYGSHGRPLILIPGLSSGSWVWRDAIEHFRGDHVIYAVTLAGFDGLPPPTRDGSLLDLADDSLLKLIRTEHVAKPVLIGHSIGGTLSIRFAEEHSELLAGVIAVDGLPVFPGTDRATATQRKAMAARMLAAISREPPSQYRSGALAYMQHIGTLDPAKAELYAPLTVRGDQASVARYMSEDMGADYRPGLKNIRVPLLEVLPYSASIDSGVGFSNAAQKTAYYQGLLDGAAHAKAVSVSPSGHFVMLDQPDQLAQIITAFLKRL